MHGHKPRKCEREVVEALPDFHSCLSNFRPPMTVRNARLIDTNDPGVQPTRVVQLDSGFRGSRGGLKHGYGFAASEDF